VAQALRRDHPEQGTLMGQAAAGRPRAARSGTPAPRRPPVSTAPPAGTALSREVLHDERMTHLIKAAFRCTSGALQKRLREHGVLYGHWTFLRILWKSDGMTQRQLSEQAGVTEASAVTALQGMEKLGYIRRARLEDNRKQVRVFLAPQGTALRPVILACAQEVNDLVVGGIAPQDLAVTRRTLLAVIDNLAREVAQDRMPAARARTRRQGPA
jgi:DNA-binding MarR family transcriptional regulator